MLVGIVSRSGLVVGLSLGIALPARQGDKPPAPEPGVYRVQLCAGPCTGAKPEAQVATAIVVILDEATAALDTTRRSLAALGTIRSYGDTAGPDNACFKVTASGHRVGDEELFFGITPRAATRWSYGAAEGFSLRVYQSPDAAYVLRWKAAGPLKQGEGWSAGWAPSTPYHRNAYFAAERIGGPAVDQCE